MGAMIASSGVLLLSAPPRLVAQPKRELPRPDPSLLQTGDLVWPKKPGAYVPYNFGSRNSPEQDRVQWIGERDAYVKKLEQSSNLDALTARRLEVLRSMNYREFIAVYEGAQIPGTPGLYAGGGVYVGHVGIVEVDATGSPWIVEALLGKGVVRTAYSKWLEDRADQVVWLSRLRQLDSPQRASVLSEAKKYLGKPYDFWNFDLNDESAFYCSKLVWLSIYRALSFPVDGVDSAKRLIWFSPKQLMNLPVLEKIHDPGPYALI